MPQFIAARQESQPLIPMRQIELKPSIRNSTNPIVTQLLTASGDQKPFVNLQKLQNLYFHLFYILDYSN